MQVFQSFKGYTFPMDFNRGETRALIGEGGEYSYIRALPD